MRVHDGRTVLDDDEKGQDDVESKDEINDLVDSKQSVQLCLGDKGDLKRDSRWW